jgi:hypothetical protein
VKKLNTKGFSAVEGLLALIAVTLISFVGYYVYHSQKNSDDTLNEAISSSTSPSVKTIKKEADPTAGWLVYKDSNVSFKYPGTWTKNVCDDGSGGGPLIMLGPENFAGHCNSDSGGEVMISYVTGDKRSDHYLDASYYPAALRVNVKVDGVIGIKESGTLNTSKEVLIGPENGSKTVEYVVYTNLTRRQNNVKT